ncbi:MAG: diacylglycerol kinase [Methylophilaceae bacterium]|nr:diacylglycerol kinase [Methylophilaceae bacterium]
MESPHKGRTGLIRLWNALHYSIDGFKAAYAHEEAFRQEVWMAIVLIPLGFYLGENGVERALLVASVLWVLIVELLNSAVEATVDLISLDHHRLAKRAKDIGSAAVLTSLVMMAVVWGLLLLN